MASAMMLEKEDRLKKVQEKKKKEEEARNAKKRAELEELHLHQLDSDEDEAILQAALALEDSRNATLDQLRQDDHQHDGAEHQADQEDGGVPRQGAQGEALIPTLSAMMHLSLSNVRNVAKGNQEMLRQTEGGAGAQVDQGVGQAQHLHHHQAGPQHEEVVQTEQQENQDLPAPRQPPPPPSATRTPSPPGQHTPARVMLTPVWKRRQMLSSSASGSRKKNPARTTTIRASASQSTTGSPSLGSGIPGIQGMAKGRPLSPQTSAALAHNIPHPTSPHRNPIQSSGPQISQGGKERMG